MKAAILHEFGKPLAVEDIADPSCPPDGVIVEVAACGVCRSDYHGWLGYNPNVKPPHVLGHELAGVIVETGSDVRKFSKGQRVTAPFIIGCGVCGDCRAGNAPICDEQMVIGFTRDGAYAQYVDVHRADFNLVALPDAMDFVSAAALGCRMTTAWRGLVDRARLQAGETFCVHGCGGVGLSAIMIAKAIGAEVIAVDVSRTALEQAARLGADHVLDAAAHDDIAAEVRKITSGGVHVSLDALGHKDVFRSSMHGLRKLGRHIQLGMPVGENSLVELELMDMIYTRQLQISGARGLAAADFTPLIAMIEDGKIDASLLVAREIALGDASRAVMDMKDYTGTGVNIITDFTR